MSNTIIGVFNTMDEAEDARELLMEKGFSASSINIHSANADSSSLSSSSFRQDDDDEGFMESIKNFFSNMFGDDDESHSSHYTEAVRRGHAVLSVEADENRVNDVCALLNRAGAIDLDTKVAEWQSQGYSGYGASALSQRTSDMSQNTDMSKRSTSIPVVEEELEVGKRTINKGAVRVHSRTVETPVSETIRLKEQHARIERHATDRPATEADMKAFEDGSIKIQETEEKAVVSKTARVKEEVEVEAEEFENTETIQDTVRHNEIEVERNNLRNSPKPGNNSPMRH